jgi:uncharacterized phage protein (TIGR02216 family)
VWAEQIGLGELQLKPWEFWKLTPREFDLMLDGFYRRQDRAWEMVGTLGQWVLAPHSKRKLTVPQLLGRGRLRLMPESARASEVLSEAMLEAERVRLEAQAIKWATEE